MKIIIAVLAAAVLLSVVSCEPNQGEPVVPVFDRTEVPMVVTVHLYDSVAAVTRAYRQHHGIPARTAIPSIQGFAVWPQWRLPDGTWVQHNDQLECEIHSVRPTRVDDNATVTLGHELLHCVYGNYHDIDPELR